MKPAAQHSRTTGPLGALWSVGARLARPKPTDYAVGNQSHLFETVLSPARYIGGLISCRQPPHARRTLAGLRSRPSFSRPYVDDLRHLPVAPVVTSLRRCGCCDTGVTHSDGKITHERGAAYD